MEPLATTYCWVTKTKFQFHCPLEDEDGGAAGAGPASILTIQSPHLLLLSCHNPNLIVTHWLVLYCMKC